MRTSRLMIFFWLTLIPYGGLLHAAQKQDAAHKEEAKPVIKIAKPTYEFREVTEGEVVKHDFTVINEGNAPLTIEKVKPG